MVNFLNLFKSKSKTVEPSVDGRRAMIHAMVAMAAADGDIGDDEIAKMDSIYARLTGQGIGAEAIGQIAYAFLENKVGIKSVLENERNDLNDDEKNLILKASHLILMADDVQADEEQQRLGEIASGLGISDTDLTSILKKMHNDDSL